MTDETRQTDWMVTVDPPTPQQYSRLCAAVGWDWCADEDRAAVALTHSLAHTTAVMSDDIVGMGRVVGDRALFFYLQDVVVDPAHQGIGIGRAIVASLMDQVRAIARPSSCVALFAAPSVARLYSDAGFEASPEGMVQFLP